ncbi:MAG: tyrosine-type recombinase/integrase [Methanosarcinales archaeon]|nr:tyrosine-type recombinase/integrase [Methanosarcinales archaeon]
MRLLTSESLLEGFKEDCELRRLASARDYIRYAREFMAFLEARGSSPRSIENEDLKAFLFTLQKRDLRSTTIDRIISCVSTFCTYLEDEKFLENNPMPTFRRRYLRVYKDSNDGQSRKLISVSEASLLVNSILDTRDQAIVLLMFKTGVRLNELRSLDVNDIDLQKGKVRLKPTAKRSNRTLYIDEETITVLHRWLNARKGRKGADGPALFISFLGTRLTGTTINLLVEKHAARVGLHDPKSERMEDRFSPHCCRHWFTTYLIRSGMPRDYVKELRGDVRHEAIDIYNHIDREALRRSYLEHIPQLGV